MSLKEEIFDVIAETVLAERSTVTGDTHLQDDLGADSLMLVELAEALNGRYSIALEADELVDVANVSEVVQLVEERIASK
jgi:acyl carrier protein